MVWALQRFCYQLSIKRFSHRNNSDSNRSESLVHCLVANKRFIHNTSVVSCHQPQRKKFQSQIGGIGVLTFPVSRVVSSHPICFASLPYACSYVCYIRYHACYNGLFAGSELSIRVHLCVVILNCFSINAL